MIDAATRAYIADLAGGDPADAALWREALTHGSTGDARNYERLEFLGDRVLGLAVAEWLHELGTGDEGRLSQRLNALVSRTTCAALAREIGLGPHVLLGKQANDDGARDSDNVLGDVMEALIGACFVTQGYGAARAMVRRLWQGEVTGETGSAKHPKSALQEWAQGRGLPLPRYVEISRSGPDHAPRFISEVRITGCKPAQGTGTSKRVAEQAAASAMLAREGVPVEAISHA